MAPESTSPRGKKANPHRGLFYAVVGVLLVSTNFITAKYALHQEKGFNPETFSLLWNVAAASYGLVIILARGRTRQLVLPRGTHGPMIAIGVLTAAGMLLTWAGLRLLDPSFAAFLHRFSPVMIILFSAVLLRERLSALEMVPLALMVGGGLMSSWGRWEEVGLGVVLTLCSCALGALTHVIAKAWVQRIPVGSMVFYRVAIAAPVIGAWGWATGTLQFDVEWVYWAALLLGALLGPCLSHYFMFASYRQWDLSRSGLVLTMQPLFVLPMAVLVLGQMPVAQELWGGLLILAGALVLVAIHWKSRSKVPVEPLEAK